MRTYSITNKQISAIHNGMCEIRRLMEMFDNMFKQDSHLNQSLIRAFEYIEPVRKELMDKVDADYDRAYNTAQRIAKLNDFKNTIWSINEVENFEEKSTVPAGSKLSSYYLDKDRHIVVEGTTWLDLWKATNLLIKETSEEHGDHVFIEGFRKVDGETYEVILGS